MKASKQKLLKAWKFFDGDFDEIHHRLGLTTVGAHTRGHRSHMNANQNRPLLHHTIWLNRGLIQFQPECHSAGQTSTE